MLVHTYRTPGNNGVSRRREITLGPISASIQIDPTVNRSEVDITAKRRAFMKVNNHSAWRKQRDIQSRRGDAS
jgi:hypothetical protein